MRLLVLSALLKITALVAALPVMPSENSGAASQTVSITNGSISGLYLESYNQDVYLGIPYAAPPLDALRFASPRPYNLSWDETRPFTQYSPACLASSGTDNSLLPQSEDCLTLNVVVPRGHNAFKKLPVAIWIHGGGFQDGSSSRPAYNLSYIVQNGDEIDKPFIGVSINYRLSGLGFLSSQEVAGKGYTNVGLRDQIQAIQWVQENIGAFGGDPGHLVIWGESAGAISIAYLLNSDKLDKNVIKGAVMESGSAFSLNELASGAQEYQQDYNAVVEHFNCSEAVDSLACLQKVGAAELLQVFNTTNGILQHGFGGPYIDGDTIKRFSSSIFKDEGSYLKVPLLIGTSTDEGSQFVNATLNTTEEFKAEIFAAYPDVTNASLDRLDELYPLGSLANSVPLDPTYNSTPAVYPPGVGTQYPRLACLRGDIKFFGPARVTAQKFTSGDNKVPVYKYRHNIPDLAAATANKWYLGTGHFQEVVYVFDNNQAPQQESLGETWNPSDKSPEIAETMSKMWASFFTDLDPNFDYGSETRAPEWPDYSVGQQNMVFDLNGFHVEQDDARTEQIEFIRSIFTQLQT